MTARLGFFLPSGLSLARRRSGGGTPTPAPTQITFGALTIAGHGGVAVTGTSISSGDPSGHFTVTSGFLVPSAAGDTANLNAGPYNIVMNDGQSFTVSIEAKCWTVRQQSEYDTVTTQSAATFTAQGGSSIALRAGEYQCKMNGNVGSALRRYDLRTGPVTIKSADITNYAIFTDRITNATFRGVRFHHLDMRGNTAAGAVPNTQCYVAQGTASFPNTHIGFEQCIMRMPDDRPFEDNSANTTLYTVTGRTSIGWINSCSTYTNNGTGFNHIEYIRNCTIIGAARAMFFTMFVGEPTVIEGNYIDLIYEIGIGVSYANGCGKLTVRNNVFSRFVAKAADVGNPHPDVILCLGNNTATTDWDVEITGNICLNNARGAPAGIALRDFFASGIDSGRFYTGSIKANVMLVPTTEGIIVQQAKNFSVINNTVYDGPILVGSGAESTTSGTHIILRNITNSIGAGGSPTLTDNVLTGTGGSLIAFSTIFDDHTATTGTRDQALVNFNRKTGGPADLGGAFDAGAIGSGAITWATTVPGNDAVVHV